jgi:hypothetical protein
MADNDAHMADVNDKTPTQPTFSAHDYQVSDIIALTDNHISDGVSSLQVLAQPDHTLQAAKVQALTQVHHPPEEPPRGGRWEMRGAMKGTISYVLAKYNEKS